MSVTKIYAGDFLVIDCGPLTDPDNGLVNTSSGTTFGNTATYTCYIGSRACQADGRWSSVEPTCSGILENYNLTKLIGIILFFTIIYYTYRTYYNY